MNYPLVLLPAFGRKYETVEDAETDYYQGKDFIINATGQYCSCRDFIGREVYLQIKTGGLTIYHPIIK
jgi:hypothetical protein